MDSVRFETAQSLRLLVHRPQGWNPQSSSFFQTHPGWSAFPPARPVTTVKPHLTLRVQ